MSNEYTTDDFRFSSKKKEPVRPGTADKVAYTVRRELIKGQWVDVKVFENPADKNYYEGRREARPTATLGGLWYGD